MARAGAGQRQHDADRGHRYAVLSGAVRTGEHPRDGEGNQRGWWRGFATGDSLAARPLHHRLRRRSPAPCRGGFFVALLLAAPAAAQTIVTSPGPAAVSITLYRAPDRPAEDEIDRDDPTGFALVTETRTISLPAGPAVIRFEGVAGNILPESAIVSGFPQEVAEKNLDADLLSPRTVYDRALGRRVLIRRTDKATGGVTEQQATIRSSAAGAAVLQVAGGYEALRCSGLPETIVQPSVPDGLSARPTLSIATSAPRATTATVTLSYLAGGFDWQADYVVNLASGGGAGPVRASLFAWVTLASSDVTSFTQARAQLVAGKPNREETPRFGNYTAGALHLRCWPTTISYGQVPPPPPPPSMAMAPAPVAMMEAGMDIVVTSSRRAAKAIEVEQGELGDFKLYTVPMPTTVASQAQKQVALMVREAVTLRTIYVSKVDRDDVDDVHPVLRMRNLAADGLGAPLPAGQVAVFQDGGDRPILLGTSSTDDKAVGEKVELDLPETPNVTADAEEIEDAKGRRRYRLTVTNANPWPIAYEARFDPEGGRFAGDVRTMLRDGRQVWEVTIPANGIRMFGYRVRDEE